MMNNYPYMANIRPTYMMEQAQPQPRPSLKGHPVASIDEARASIIDFDGSIFYFPDLANRRIYTKQINMDGSASLNMYELKDIPVPVPASTGNFVTREEFDMALNKIQETFKLIAASAEKPAEPAATPSSETSEKKTQDAPSSDYFF